MATILNEAPYKPITTVILEDGSTLQWNSWIVARASSPLAMILIRDGQLNLSSWPATTIKNIGDSLMLGTPLSTHEDVLDSLEFIEMYMIDGLRSVVNAVSTSMEYPKEVRDRAADVTKILKTNKESKFDWYQRLN